MRTLIITSHRRCWHWPLLRFGGIGPFSHASRAAEPTAHAFFPFCIDWHDAKKRTYRRASRDAQGAGL